MPSPRPSMPTGAAPYTSAPPALSSFAVTQGRFLMSDNIYPITEVYGSSAESVDDAIRKAVSAASKSVRNIEWFEVTQIRGHVEDGEVAHYQVGVKLGFRLER